MHKDNAEIVERMRKYLETKGLTYREFSKTLEISFSNLSNYLNGKSDIQKIFILLQTKAGINLEWLITGEGEPELDTFSQKKRLGRAIDYTRDEILSGMKSEFSNILQFKEPTFEEIKVMSESDYKLSQYKLQLKKQITDLIKFLEIDIPQNIEYGFSVYPEEMYEKYSGKDDDEYPHFYLERFFERNP